MKEEKPMCKIRTGNSKVKGIREEIKKKKVRLNVERNGKSKNLK